MNVKLTPELEAMVRRKVESGDYADQSEVIREGLRLLIERDLENEHLVSTWRAALARGLEEADAGKLQDGPGVILRLRQELQQSKRSIELLSPQRLTSTGETLNRLSSFCRGRQDAITRFIVGIKEDMSTI